MTNEANSARLFELISNRIMGGTIRPGTKLTESGLAKELGVSRAPLREALLKLEERQLIERTPFSGTRVAIMSPRSVEQMFEIRETLEGLACKKAAERITDTEIDGLRSWIDASEARIRGVTSEDSKSLDAIGDFHDEIARIGGNEELRKLLGREIWKFLRVNYQIHARTPERLVQATLEHRRIVEALEARDCDLAELLMRRHIAGARRGILDGASS